MKRYWHLQLRAARERRPMGATAFTLTELLIVIAVLALLATTQLPALTRAKVPLKLTQCLNNLRQIGQATMVYRADNNDTYPFGNRCTGPGTGSRSVLDPTCWPMQLLQYLGGYQTNIQPIIYVCPNEKGTASGWVFQVHYAANRYLLSDMDDRDTPITGPVVRNPSRYWMFIGKDPFQFCNLRSGSLRTFLSAWNYPPGIPGLRRHNQGTSSAAADGHVEWLRMPLYQPSMPPPLSFLELGDCASGINPASTWQDPTIPSDHNGGRVKLWARYSQALPGQPSF